MNGREKAIFITLLAVYLFYQRPPFFANRNFALTYSIVEQKTLSINDNKELAGSDISFYDGNYYIAANPGLSFLSVPVYFVLYQIEKLMPEASLNARQINGILSNILINCVLVSWMAILFYRILAHFGIDEKRRFIYTFGLSLGTIIFYHSLEYFATNTVGTFFAFAAYYIVNQENRDEYELPNWSKALLSGMCCGVCILLSIEYILFAGIFAIYIAIRLRFLKTAVFLAGTGIVVSILFLYQKACFDGYFTGYAAYMIDDYFMDLRSSGIRGMGSIWSLQPLYQLTIGLRRGFFVFMPITLLTLYCVFSFLIRMAVNRKRKTIVSGSGAKREVFFGASVFLIYLAVLSVSEYWEGGSSFGPRYMIVVLPFFMIAGAVSAPNVNIKTLQLFFILSVFFNWTGAQFVFTNDMNILNVFNLLLQNGPSSHFASYLVSNTSIFESIVRARTVAALTTAMLFLMIVGLWLMWIVQMRRDKNLRV